MPRLFICDGVPALSFLLPEVEALTIPILDVGRRSKFSDIQRYSIRFVDHLCADSLSRARPPSPSIADAWNAIKFTRQSLRHEP